MQLPQERNFAFLISDTFNFFKVYGKNYFKNYFIINGALLLILTLFSVFAYRELFMQLLAGNTNGDNYFFENYFSDNWVMLLLSGIVSFILIFILSLTTYTFPVFYMKRLANNQRDISADDLLNDLKKNIGKFVIFALGFIFILMPLMMIAMTISSFLMVIIIGFFLLLILFPAFVNVISITLYDYMGTDKGYFESLSYAMRQVLGNMFSKEGKFWKYFGSVMIIGLITYIVNAAFSIIPYVLTIAAATTAPNFDETSDPTSLFSSATGIGIVVMYGVMILVSTISYNLISINAGLIYYDTRKDLHRLNNLTEIDNIGTSEA